MTEEQVKELMAQLTREEKIIIVEMLRENDHFKSANLDKPVVIRV